MVSLRSPKRLPGTQDKWKQMWPTTEGKHRHYTAVPEREARSTILQLRGKKRAEKQLERTAEANLTLWLGETEGIGASLGNKPKPA